jgi:hypothetical protein
MKDAAAPCLALFAGIAALTSAVADVAGLRLDRPGLWVAGAGLLLVAAGLGAAAVGASLLRPVRADRRRPADRLATGAAVLAVPLLGLARWVRGHPEVAPDPPLVAAAVFGAALLGGLARRAGGWRP